MIYYFWDKMNDELEILGEDGQFYLYGQDTVARDQGDPDEKWQYWLHIHPMQNVSPLNEWDRYELMDPESGEWIPWSSVIHRQKLLLEIHKAARDPHWREAIYRG